MGYDIASIATATDLACEEFNKVQRSTLLRATGCLPNVRPESMDVLINCEPLFLHLKQRQADEIARIYCKGEGDSTKKEFQESNDLMKEKRLRST